MRKITFKLQLDTHILMNVQMPTGTSIYFLSSPYKVTDPNTCRLKRNCEKNKHIPLHIGLSMDFSSISTFQDLESNSEKSYCLKKKVHCIIFHICTNAYPFTLWHNVFAMVCFMPKWVKRLCKANFYDSKYSHLSTNWFLTSN